MKKEKLSQTEKVERTEKESKELKKEIVSLRKEIKTKAINYITAGLGLVVGLAWNEFIKDTINYLYPGEANSLIAKFIYAFILTIVVVLMTMYLSKVFDVKTKKGKK